MYYAILVYTFNYHALAVIPLGVIFRVIDAYSFVIDD